VYYKARRIALNNDQRYHIVALLYRNKSIIRIGYNQCKTHRRFGRVQDNGFENYHLHAEMDALISSKPGDRLFVLRFSKNGDLTMAKPCKYCMEFIKSHGIKCVHFSNWDGEIEKVKIG
jgi:deoxycytidylate deaminase